MIGAGTTVVVTGASSGVGRATVQELGKRRANVALIARGRDGLDAAASAVERAGGRALVLPLDVSDAASVAEAAQSTEDVLGPIDVWVNCAMTAVLAPVAETTAEEFRRVTEVTYLGYVNGTLAALRHMRSRDRGTIVQVGSALAHRSIPLQATYCGAKHAIKGFTESLRCELLHERSGVRVTMVQLPGLNTPQFEHVQTTLPRQPRPVAPVYQPELAARAVLHAAEHPRRERYVGASTPLVIWGGRFLPGLADRYLARTNYDAQQSDEPLPADHRSNLWQAGPGDPGAHGRFDDEAHDGSLQWTVSSRRRPVLAALAIAGAGAAGWWRRR